MTYLENSNVTLSPVTFSFASNDLSVFDLKPFMTDVIPEWRKFNFKSDSSYQYSLRFNPMRICINRLATGKTF